MGGKDKYHIVQPSNSVLIYAIAREDRMLQASNARRLLSFVETGERWGVSTFTIRRLVDRNLITTVNIGARRFIPISEVERVEMEGVGKARARKSQVAV